MNYLEYLNNLFLNQKEYLGSDKPVNIFPPLLSVHVITYQHVKFISKCLDGILMQKTNFPYEIVIGEDGSNDGTTEICKKYASNYTNIIRLFIRDRTKTVITDQNNTIYFNGKLTLKSCRGKYIAICEGDDYWIDQYKLQKQIDFLESNRDYGIIHTGVKVVDSVNNLILTSYSSKPSGDVFYDLLLKSAFIVTCSVCVRSDLMHKIYLYGNENNLKCIFDYWLWLHIAMRSKIHYDPSVTSAYRSHSGGVTQSNRKYFYSVTPLAVMDVISYKFKYYPEIFFLYRWRMYIAFCRAITSRSITIKDRIHYSVFLIKHPVSFFAFIPALFKKIGKKINKLK